jgi:pilus assembly protein FimV
MPKFFLFLACYIYMGLISYVSAQETVHTYGPIQQGEMLWNIAAKVSPSSVNRYQAILALHKANPQAFSVSCNINSLKIGETLRIPSLSEMQALSRAEAIKEFNRQTEEWQARRDNPIVCPEIEEPETPAELTTTEQETKPLLSVPSETLTENANTSTVSATAPIARPSPIAEQANTMSTTSVSHADDSVNDNLSSSIYIFVSIATVVIIAFLTTFFWLRKRKALKNDTDSEPFDEMPLKTSSAEKQV